MCKYSVQFINGKTKKTLKKGLTMEEAYAEIQRTLNRSAYTYIDDKAFNQGESGEVRCGYFGKDQLDYIYRIVEEKPAKEEPLHVTVHIGKFTLYRRMSCEALHKYVHSIVAKGYKLYRRLDGNGIGRIDESKICEAFFANGIALRKEDKMIVLEQTPKSKWK